jgi:hypothetical protein
MTRKAKRNKALFLAKISHIDTTAKRCYNEIRKAVINMKNTLKICISLILCFAIIFAASSCDFIDNIKNYIISDGGNDIIADNTDNATDTGDTDNVGDSDKTEADIIADILSKPVNCDDIQYKAGLDEYNLPDGYTAGLTTHSCDLSDFGYYWLETYEDVLEAVTLLEYHNSNILKTIGFDCDGEPYDIKWLFVYERRYADKLVEGKNYFDRKIDNCQFVCYTFSKEVTIEELNFAQTYFYGSMRITYYPNNAVIEDPELLSISWNNNKEHPTDYFVFYDSLKIADIYRNIPKDTLSDEYIEILLNSLITFADGTYDPYLVFENNTDN